MTHPSIIWGAFARSVGTVARSMRPVASMAVVNSHSPAVELLSIANPVAAFLNFGRLCANAGKCFSLLRSLVQHPQKSGRSGFHRFQFAPIPFVAAAHESNVAKGSCHERQSACKR